MICAGCEAAGQAQRGSAPCPSPAVCCGGRLGLSPLVEQWGSQARHMHAGGGSATLVGAATPHHAPYGLVEK